ncbi:MAG: lycopene cyclase domain-containing protein [Nocardioidaceae bacterium]|nr:lycopene cyclase domain-containing protein [Nocardioidaceae bacterium]
MRAWVYAGMLVFVVVATLPLELLLGTRVYARWRRTGLTLLCVAPVFVLWDVLAIHAGHWSFDLTQTLGIVLPGDLPLEEALFFVVVPVASVLSLEAVRRVRGWPVRGEEHR